MRTLAEPSYQLTDDELERAVGGGAYRTVNRSFSDARQFIEEPWALVQAGFADAPGRGPSRYLECDMITATLDLAFHGG